jgi:hypothetical protein
MPPFNKTRHVVSSPQLSCHAGQGLRRRENFRGTRANPSSGFTADQKRHRKRRASRSRYYAAANSASIACFTALKSCHSATSVPLTKIVGVLSIPWAWASAMEA